MDGLASINGKIVSLAQATIPILDRGLLYGDGVFEGVRLIQGKVLLHFEHLERLYRSAERIRLPMIEKEVYEEQLGALLKASKQSDGYIRVIATRGVGEMGINPTKHISTNLYLILTTINLFPSEIYQSGIRVIVAKTRKIPPQSFDCSVKSLCYLPNVMAMWEAVDRGASEAIMLGTDGFVSEATVENIFGVSGNTIFTPALGNNCLPGITRNKIIELASEHGITVQEGQYLPEAFMTADEVFLTGTGAGIVPVREIDDRIIGNGSMGPITLRLRETYESRIEEFCYSLHG